MSSPDEKITMENVNVPGHTTRVNKTIDIIGNKLLPLVGKLSALV